MSSLHPKEKKKKVPCMQLIFKCKFITGANNVIILVSYLQRSKIHICTYAFVLIIYFFLLSLAFNTIIKSL